MSELRKMNIFDVRREYEYNKINNIPSHNSKMLRELRMMQSILDN